MRGKGTGMSGTGMKKEEWGEWHRNKNEWKGDERRGMGMICTETGMSGTWMREEE